MGNFHNKENKVSIFSVDNMSLYRDYKRHLSNSWGIKQAASTLMLIMTLVVIGFFGWNIISRSSQDRNTSNVLGYSSEHTDKKTIDEDLLCVRVGGLIERRLVDAKEEPWCILRDGRECLLKTYVETGVCGNEESSGVVLGVTETSSPFLGATETQTASPGPLVYTLNLSPKHVDSISKRILLADFLYSVLEFDRQGIPIQAMQQLLFDTRLASPYETGRSKFEGTYYMIFDWQQPLDNSVYETEHIVITAEAVSLAAFPEIRNLRYCSSNEECEIRTNLCTYGAFNFFQPYLDAWSCNGVTDQGGGNQIFYDDERGCEAKIIYSQPRCQNNTCIAGQSQSLCI